MCSEWGSVSLSELFHRPCTLRGEGWYVGMQPISSPEQGFLFWLRCSNFHLFMWKSLSLSRMFSVIFLKKNHSELLLSWLLDLSSCSWKWALVVLIAAQVRWTSCSCLQVNTTENTKESFSCWWTEAPNFLGHPQCPKRSLWQGRVLRAFLLVLTVLLPPSILAQIFTEVLKFHGLFLASI